MKIKDKNINTNFKTKNTMCARPKNKHIFIAMK